MNKESLTKFYNAYRLYIFPLVISLSCLTLIILVIYPQISKLIGNIEVEANLKSKVVSLEAKAETLDGFDSTVLSRRVAYVLNSYPAEKDFAQVIGLIPQLAANSGFSVTALSFGSFAPSSEEEKNYRVTTEVVGPGSLMKTLVASIENSPRLMRINSLEVNASKGGSDEVSATFGIDVLYATLPKNFGTVDTPLPELSAEEEQIIAKLAQSAPSAATTTPVSSVPRGKANPFE